MHTRVHAHERAQGMENGESLGRWQHGARRPPLTLTALLALRDNQGVPRVAEAQIGAHAVDTVTFSSTRILQALVFICAQARKEDRLSAPAAPAAPHQPHGAPGGQGSAEMPESLPQEPEGPKGLLTPVREALLFQPALSIRAGGAGPSRSPPPQGCPGPACPARPSPRRRC